VEQTGGFTIVLYSRSRPDDCEHSPYGAVTCESPDGRFLVMGGTGYGEDGTILCTLAAAAQLPERVRLFH
jgi:hypothetical protein